MDVRPTRRSVSELALFGGSKWFDVPKSTSNLVGPDFDRFLDYSQSIFDAAGRPPGTVTARFEARLAAFHETGYCVAFCSGFWALATAIVALARPGRREVVIPSLTYRRMADVIAWTGLLPRFCEVDADTLAISAATAAPWICDDTALLLAVHPIVNCCDAQALADLADETHVPILFDGVESVYERCIDGQGRSRKVGAFGHAECFSLHASKLINGFEGGYVTTNDAALARRLVDLRNGSMVLPGAIDARLADMHAAMALANLDELDAQVARNRARYERYRVALAAIQGVRLLTFDESQPTSYKNIVVELTAEWPLTRSLTLEMLNAENILARAYYAPPLHSKPMAYPHIAAELPVTDQLSQRFMLLPCGEFVTLDDIDEVAKLLSFACAHADAVRACRASQEQKP
ncbi:DegT/DnrJ/EryC1/StrS family aminotransferase [Trinickia dinghuensis]|uniref:Aminotransferase class I/II-fold pyridoxal phosphate-dependent enzyme n=1 Tax=Trinickia dinghuensis TaxID=2291023 RepID=A0A3D8K1A9_9BURK|nr:aminotransferase class I/II-fold pyridoxal phosphate-dependent enzyme [Trinickia dinghuensis]RDU98391.1 aminotransferase class I/II-fold pyridoxal phosphate-dependent enzyme [Trinickia dinghuensis]